MPLFLYKCTTCGQVDEIILSREAGVHRLLCSRCKGISFKQLTFPAMVIMRGEGGYPSRRKFYRETAPYCGSAKAWSKEDALKSRANDAEG